MARNRSVETATTARADTVMAMLPKGLKWVEEGGLHQWENLTVTEGGKWWKIVLLYWNG